MKNTHEILMIIALLLGSVATSIIGIGGSIEFAFYLIVGAVYIGSLSIVIKDEMAINLRNDKAKKSLTQCANHCACSNEEKTGTTTVECCNNCGKPTEDFWHCG